jgi:hypothetical protein
MQMVASALQDEARVSDRVGDSVSSPQDVQSGSAAPVNAEALAESGEESKIASIAGETAAHETGDAPVTMASTAESVVAAGTSRWTAVPVALEGEEAAISLDQEMQKAHAAFAAADSAGVVGAPEAAIVENSSRTEAAVETPVAISNPEPEAVQNPEHAVSGDAVVAETAAGPTEVASPSSEPSESTSLPEATDASSPEPEAAVLTPASVEVAPVEAQVETSPAAESAEPRQEPVPEPAPVAEFVSPVVEREVADAAGQAAPALETQPAPEAEPAMAEHRLDPETVKSTAAAWASWRQNRDTGKDDNAAEVQSRETAFDAPEPAPTEATARAVAAGAEQTMQEAAAAASPESDNRTDVASIVDSVLADLRPKLMKEISRKMSEKK